MVKTTVTQCPIYEHEKNTYREIQRLMHGEKSVIDLQTGRVVAYSDSRFIILILFGVTSQHTHKKKKKL